MPELPEVETVRRTLAPAIGLRVHAVWTSGLPLRLNQKVDRRMLTRAAKGHTIEDIRRWGKYLLLDFTDSDRSVLVHLGMSGRLRLMEARTERAPHTHVVFALNGGRSGPTDLPGRELRYSDPRRFGQVAWVHRGREREHPSLARLGLDPLTEELTGAHLHEHMKKTRRPIKIFLLDQQAVAGVGNIYASEALWQARIRPTTPANRISRKRADALAAAIIEVFDRALGARRHQPARLRQRRRPRGHPRPLPLGVRPRRIAVPASGLPDPDPSHGHAKPRHLPLSPVPAPLRSAPRRQN